MSLNVREIKESDNAIMRELALKNDPLDKHTPYTYWVMARFFGSCSFLLCNDDEPIGYIMTLYNKERLFVWQIAVSSEYRGKGCSRLLLDAVTKKARDLSLNMCVTIADDNQASYNAFSKYCSANSIRMYKTGEISIPVFEKPNDPEVETFYNLDFIDSCKFREKITQNGIV